MREFFNADEAAVELRKLTNADWTAAQVLREAKAGRLPVCFDFAGELVTHSVDGRVEPGGSSPRVLDFDGVVRSLTQPTADGICGFGVLVEIQEAHRLKFCHKDGKLTRGIALPTESPHGVRIKAGHKVECWIEDAGVTPDAFLFHTDDLNKLVSTTQAVPALSEFAPVPAQPQAAPATVAADSVSNTPAMKPPPVATVDVAHALDGLRGWNEKAWKDNLGSPPKWLEACIALRGERGKREHHWNPVFIGAALVHNGHAKANSIRARFQKKPQLRDWLEEWKTYEADYFDSP